MIASNLKFLRKSKNLNQAQMLDFIGIKGNTRWSDYERGKANPPIDILLKISELFHITLDDLIKSELSNAHLIGNNTNKKSTEIAHLNAHANAHLKGKTPPHSVVFEDQEQYFRMPKLITVDSNEQENVILLPVKARAGYLNGYGDEVFMSKLPAYRLPGLSNGTFRLFEVDGLSMYPTLNDKDIVITKFVENLNEIRDDRLYVVLTKNDGVVVKRVLNRLQKDGKLILKSDNYKDRDLYPNLVIPPEEVLEVWYATSFISYQMRPPSEMYNRVIDLEGRLTIMEDQLKNSTQKGTKK